MKKAVASLICLCLLMIGTQSFAHPGRTDSGGGHTCRTNCTKWGLSYGEYHYHNGGHSQLSGNSSYNSPKPVKKSIISPKVKVIIAVDSANVYNIPYISDYYVEGQLPYGSEVYDFGGYQEFYTMVSGGVDVFVSKSVTTSYTPIKAKNITVRVDKGFIFNIPSDKGKVRGFFTKNRKVTAIGEMGKFYYISTIDYQGKPIKGFISKSIAW